MHRNGVHPLDFCFCVYLFEEVFHCYLAVDVVRISDDGHTSPHN